MKKHRFFPLMIIVFLLPAFAAEGPDSSAPAGSFEAALQSHLTYVKNEVAKLCDPETGMPVEIPHFDLIYETAGNITASDHPETDLAIAYSLLGRASDVGTKVPNMRLPLRFPRAHHIDPETGFEWYYFGTTLDVRDPEGNEGRVAILLSMQKQRIIGLTTQKAYGLSDNECMMFVNLVTATIDLPGTRKTIRRTENFQLPALGGSGGFSSKGEAFYMICGTDSLTGTRHVLPLTAVVRDGDNLNLELTFIPPEGMKPRHAFFKQGMPNLALKGRGYTYDPSPGIYYSWPQLRIDLEKDKHLVIDGTAYHIHGGGAWMDHQLMMQSLKNPKNEQHPIPFIEDPLPFNGWSWQFFNLDNGHAFTGASFQKGEFDPSPTIVYGYYIKPTKNGKRWEAVYLWGDMHMKDFKAFPVITDDPASPTVMLPNRWDYDNIQTVKGLLFAGTATPWFFDGSFNGQNRQIIGENPVDYRDSLHADIRGTGFCESVGFEPVESYTERAVTYLKRNR
jgi:hypothetical protein